MDDLWECDDFEASSLSCYQCLINTLDDLSSSQVITSTLYTFVSETIHTSHTFIFCELIESYLWRENDFPFLAHLQISEIKKIFSIFAILHQYPEFEDITKISKRYHVSIEGERDYWDQGSVRRIFYEPSKIQRWALSILHDNSLTHDTKAIR